MKPRMFMPFLAIIVSVLVANAQSSSPAAISGQEQIQASKSPASQPPAKPADKKGEDCGCESKNTPAQVAAVANGVMITTKEIDDQINSEKAGLQKRSLKPAAAS